MVAAVSVCRGDGQHPGKSEVDIRPDAFASPNEPFGLTKSSPIKLLKMTRLFWVYFAKRVISCVLVIVYQHDVLKSKILAFKTAYLVIHAMVVIHN